MTDGQGKTILWLARGLNTELTGIERFISALHDDLASHQVISKSSWSMVVDADSEWANPLESEGWQIRRAGTISRTGRPVGPDGSPRIVHSFGRGSFPIRTRGATRIYSVYDWGPFHDAYLPWVARVAWGRAIAMGVGRADIVHLLNEHLAVTKPRLVPRPKRHVVCAPSTRLPEHRRDDVEPTHALFVGTVGARKRVDAIVDMANYTNTLVRLVGDGTEPYGQSSPSVVAQGRVSEELLDHYFDSASCILLVSAYEGFGIPVLEAAIRGIHSVVSAEVMSNLPSELQPYCHVVDPDRPADFASAIQFAASKRGAPLIYDALRPLRELYATELARS